VRANVWRVAEDKPQKRAVIGRGGMTGIDAPTIVTERREIVKTLKNLITEHSLPLWSGEGWDPAAGGFVEEAR
jgi:hypothetical protein